jgi:hypothetical protein
MSKAVFRSPSDLLDIEDDPLASFCLDRAVWTFGSSLQGELNSIEDTDKNKIERARDNIFRRWLPDSPQSKAFADPANLGSKRK